MCVCVIICRYMYTNIQKSQHVPVLVCMHPTKKISNIYLREYIYCMCVYMCVCVYVPLYTFLCVCLFLFTGTQIYRDHSTEYWPICRKFLRTTTLFRFLAPDRFPWMRHTRWYISWIPIIFLIHLSCIQSDYVYFVHTHIHKHFAYTWVCSNTRTEATICRPIYTNTLLISIFSVSQEYIDTQHKWKSKEPAAEAAPAAASVENPESAPK